jgi:hypothetical protein
MIPKLFLAIAPLIAQADLCTVLCQRDGPEVCTAGSWTKDNGTCHGYLFRENPIYGEYCYHTKATAEKCPSNGIVVKATDVERLLTVPKVHAISPTQVSIKLGHPVHEMVTLRSIRLVVQDAEWFKASAEDMIENDLEGILNDLVFMRGIPSFPIAEGVNVVEHNFWTAGRYNGGHLNCGEDVGSTYFERAPDHIFVNADWPLRICSLMKAIIGRFQ